MASVAIFMSLGIIGNACAKLGTMMEAWMNKVILIGRVVSDPQDSELPSGQKAICFKVSPQENWAGPRTPTLTDQVDWHSIVLCSEQVIRYAQTYLSEGSLIYLEGVLCTRIWQDQSGNKNQVADIIVGPHQGRIVGLSHKRNTNLDGDHYQGDVSNYDIASGEVPF